jgi:hypothetical protein
MIILPNCLIIYLTEGSTLRGLKSPRCLIIHLTKETEDELMKTRATQVNLEHFRRRYLRSKRKAKTKLLDELCDLYGYNRKYLLQFFNFITRKQYIRRGVKPRYEGKELLEPLKRIWLATDQLCGKRLKTAIPLWLPSYEASYELLSEEVKKKLLSMSASTLDRLLKPFRVHYKRHGLTGTKPGYLLKNQIPIKTEHWDVTKPGFMEADTVAHCGNSIAGEYAWSITLTDILTGWTEIRATFGKGEGGVVEQIENIEKNLPFELLGFDCDNGSEFLNWHLMRYFQKDRKQKVQFTRSRPYRKNDNAHVEQKNWTHVRHLFGYDRFDKRGLVALMNELYKNEWSLYQNYFMPNQKLLSKEKINSKYRRKHDKAKTPYQRLLESEHVGEEKKMELALLYQQLNPFELKKRIEKKLRHVFKYVTVAKKPRTKI